MKRVNNKIRTFLVDYFDLFLMSLSCNIEFEIKVSCTLSKLYHAYNSILDEIDNNIYIMMEDEEKGIIGIYYLLQKYMCNGKRNYFTNRIYNRRIERFIRNSFEQHYVAFITK